MEANGCADRFPVALGSIHATHWRGLAKRARFLTARVWQGRKGFDLWFIFGS
jgi:hypothetical protein